MSASPAAMKSVERMNQAFVGGRVENPAEPAVTPHTLVSPEGMVLNELKGGPVCRTREDYEQMVKNAVGHDEQATFALMLSGKCSIPPMHTRVSIADTAMFSGLIKVRPYGGSMPGEGWTADENVCLGRQCP